MAIAETHIEQTWAEIGHGFAQIFLTVVLLAFVGLIFAVGIVWTLSSAFGEELTRYPWHIVLWIDIAFVLVAAVLSDLAEAPTPESKSDSLSWALASFVMAVSTLGALGSHTGKIWRSVFESGKAELEDPTILSELICAHFTRDCGHIYFGTTLAITSIALLMAAVSAFLLRKRGKDKSDEARAYSVFIASALLFGLYTVVNQKWDAPGPPLPAITWLQFMWLATVLLFFLTFYLIVGKIISVTRTKTRSIGRAWGIARSDKERQAIAQAEKTNEIRSAISLLRAIMPLATTASVALVALLVSLRFISDIDITSNIRRLLDMAVLFSYLSMVLLALLITPVIINLVVVVTMRVFAFVVRKLKELLGSPPSQKTRHRVSPPQRAREKPVPPPKSRPMRATKSTGERIKGFLDLLRRVKLAPEWSRVLRRGSVAISSVLVTLLFDYVATLPGTPPPPSGWAGGKEALLPFGSAVGKGRMPPLSFTKAPIDCSLTQPIAWARSEIDGLHASAKSCRFTGDIPCLRATIVVVGAASSVGKRADEIRRARDRGRTLARFLEGDFRERCGRDAAVQSYVLNLGHYSRGSLADLSQREVVVLFSRGDDDDLTTANVLENYVEGEGRFSEYTNCDFYLLGSTDVEFVRKLNCGATVTRQ